MTDKEIFNRSELLLGEAGMERIRNTRVIIFGVGGVGSWCAEALVRNGITRMTIVDSDVVCVTNCNRQLMATTRTIGRPKVDALRERLLEINPDAEIVALQQIYTPENAESFHLEDYDYVVDAIDSLRNKIDLVVRVTNIGKGTAESTNNNVSAGTESTNVNVSESTNNNVSYPKLFSSLGAALRIDPTKVRVAEFWKVTGDPLASAMRSSMRKHKLFPGRKFLCLYSEEPPLPNLGAGISDGSQMFTKVQANGSLCHITGIFGMTLAGLIIKDINSLSSKK